MENILQTFDCISLFKPFGFMKSLKEVKYFKDNLVPSASSRYNRKAKKMKGEGKGAGLVLGVK